MSTIEGLKAIAAREWTAAIGGERLQRTAGERGIVLVEQLSRRERQRVEVAPQRARAILVHHAVGLHPQIGDRAVILTAIERVDELERGVFAFAAADDVDTRCVDDLGEIGRVRAAHVADAAGVMLLDVGIQAQVEAVQPRRGPEGDHVGLVVAHVVEHVVAARTDETAVVPGLLQDARDVERAERLRAFDLLDDEEDLLGHWAHDSRFVGKREPIRLTDDRIEVVRTRERQYEPA
jgi:hypothetical protein